ncbi:beta-ketoacyl-ACP synthase III [Saccharibacillus sp. CPCC 101409]|uniref:beta-ketoacyl-ACP synthase III n=1 Tax=Saccharibacillus sp. CPCC 101409 TaxID=3058041 RepID=UPI002671CCAF|nr:beta-ketoacyl-ACP synthase III [Saccharibacillus sp. CPCC 101409]MDO3410043.1 beta-ketoacyl-ACP synthase III [Saccharibacillus sp. CPCC 101409]
MQARRVKITGTGKYVPGAGIPDSEIDRRLGIEPGWVMRKTSVANRHFAGEETAAQMGAFAVRDALEAAGLSFSDIDCLVCASGTMQQPIPCTASLIQEALGEQDSGVPCFDINSTCLSFVTALDTMSYPVDAGRYRRILIVSTEIASKGLDWSNKESAALFGDGAAAAVVERSAEGEPSRILHAAMTTHSEGAHHSEIRGGGSGIPASLYSEENAADYLFSMDGEAIFRQASRLLPEFMRKLLSGAGLSMSDFKLVVPHQGSVMAMKLLRRKLGISEEQMLFIAPHYGNVIASSIPLGLDMAVREGRLARGDNVLLVGTSAGLSLGGVALVY